MNYLCHFNVGLGQYAAHVYMSVCQHILPCLQRHVIVFDYHFKHQTALVAVRRTSSNGHVCCL